MPCTDAGAGRPWAALAASLALWWTAVHGTDVGRVTTSGLGLVTALPVAERLTSQIAYAADPALDDATLQAFADTIIPGRKAATTDLGGTRNRCELMSPDQYCCPPRTA